MPFEDTWIRKRIKAAMMAKGWSDYQLAQAVRRIVPSSRKASAERTVYQFLSDKPHNVSDRTLAPMLEALGLTIRG